MKTLLLRALALLLLVLTAQGTPLSGTKSVGPTGNYASITAAIADVQSVGNGLGGALILELQATYLSNVETFPLVIPALNGASAVNTLTIRPASGATALSISSADTTAATVDLNGAQFVSIDGRPGGVGTAKHLTIANTSTSGVALRFINEASNNTIRDTTLRGVNTSISKGTVFFSNTTGANGNDNNTIDHCDIGDGGSTPSNGIYALGTTTTAAQNNSGNTVSNCNVFNFYSGTVDSAGVRLDGGNTDWTISGNSFYQTASRVAAAFVVRPIIVNNTLGNNFTVTGNFIGGSAPNAGGTAWTTTGTTATHRFAGTYLNVGTSTPSSVQGNTISNIVWTSSSTGSTLPGVWSGIYVQAGSANIGTGTGNTIGNGTGTGSIAVTTSGSGGTAFGIGSFSGGTVSIVNNTIGSINVNGTAATVSASLVGIQADPSGGGTYTITGNTVGSTTTSNSLNATTAATSGGQQVTGILSAGIISNVITGNTVANLNNNYAGINVGQVRGIVTTNGANTITGNTVRNLSTTSVNSFPATAGSVLGIAQSSAAANQVVSQNVVHSLYNTAATGTVSVTGIYYAGSTTTGTNFIARNFVHSLSITSASLTVLTGMEFGGGTFTAKNNMVRVGLDANGSSTAGSAQLRGIYDNGTSEGRNFYHNSVYVGGTQTGSASITTAFSSTGATNARDYRNNIFVSTRSRGGTATGVYLAVNYGGTTVNPPGLTASNNIFFASGTGSALGSYNGPIIFSLGAWQAATGMDTLSLNADPVFVNPAGTAATVDLHAQAASPANSAAALIAAVTDDMDGQPRNANFPDIGADEFDAVEIAVEQPAGTNLTDGTSTVAFGSAPVGGNTVRTFTVRNTGNLNLTLGAITMDGVAAAAFTVNTAGMSTTLVPGSSTTFAVTFAPASTGGKTAALHIANNDPNENAFDINLGGFCTTGIPLSGTKTIGPTGNYPFIGNAIADIQARGLAGPLVLELQPAYVSTGEASPITFTNLGSSAANPITLRPGSGAAGLSIISASTIATVDLNGAQFVTLDGRPGGAGAANQLTIGNTSTGGVAVRLINEAAANTIQYVTLQGVNTSATSGTVVFATTSGAGGNDGNTIDHCEIRDGATTPANAIYSAGAFATPTQNNSGNTISNCNIFNFYTATAVDSAGVRLDGGNTDWLISGNSFYQTASRAAVAANVRAIYINNTNGNNFAVTGNFIGGSAANAAGSPWTTTDTIFNAHQFVGIHLNIGTATPSSVQDNTVGNFNWGTSSGAITSPGIWSGIYVQTGWANVGTVTGNTIGSGSGTGSVSVTTSNSFGGTSYGISSASNGTVAISNNTVGSITVNGATSSLSASLVGIQASPSSGGSYAITGNTVGSTTTANSLNCATSSTSVNGPQFLAGILSSCSGTAAITGNTVANLNNNHNTNNSSSQVRGIVTSAGSNAITGNMVRNLSSTSQSTGATASASVMGISQISTVAVQTISQNTVHSLSNAAVSAGVTVTGIYYAGNLITGPNVIDRNFVHSLSISSTSTSSTVIGMQFATLTGNYSAQNNMVRVGIDSNGSSTAGTSVLIGIHDIGGSDDRSYLHNSVLVGGIATSGAASTFAFSGGSSTSVRTFKNNIYVNARGNSGGTGKHYAVTYGGSTSSLAASNNIYLASGAGGVLGLYNSTDRTTLAAWQSVTGKESASLNTDPLFINPAGTAAAVDLHVQPGSPACGTGAFIASVTTDFDGEGRSAIAPYIGADEILAPVVTLNPVDVTVVSGANALFTATAVGNPLPEVQWQVNTGSGFLNLPGQTATSLAITGATFSLNQNQYRAVFTNASGFANSNPAVLTVNRPPAAGPVTVSRHPTGNVKLTFAQILAQTSDPDAIDTVSFLGAGNGAHGTTMVIGGIVLYTPNANDQNADSFSYTVRDSRGATATGTVNVNIIVDNAPAQNITKLTVLPNGDVAIDFAGIPGYTYGLQYSPDLIVPWVNIGSVTTNAFGAAHVVDTPPPGPGGSGFYRLVYPVPIVP